jgi:hypothetical protein
MNKMGGACDTYRKERCIQGSGGKETFGRPRHRWQDSIKMDLQGEEWEAWTGLI